VAKGNVLLINAATANLVFINAATEILYKPMNPAQEVSELLDIRSACSLLRVLLEPEGGGSIFMRIMNKFLSEYIT
jgi:hypothetical protein